MTQNQCMFFGGNTFAVMFFYVTVFSISNARAGPVGPFEFSVAPGLFHALVGLHAGVVATGFLCWVFVEQHDPSLPSCFGACLPTTRKWTASKYVSEHRKPIEGLDHFCSWLNVAIARSNYVPFFVLTCCGVLQYALQALVGGLLLTLWHQDLEAKTAGPDDPDALVAHTAAALLVLGSLGMGFPFVMLLLFHATLLRSGETTYTYIQNAQKKEYSARKQRQQELKAQADGLSAEAQPLSRGAGAGAVEGGGGGGKARGHSAAGYAKAEEGRFGDPPASPPPGTLAAAGTELVWDQP